jgi:hypothetical protein
MTPEPANARRDESAAPIIKFYRMTTQGLDPMRADRSALGTLPTMAFQYCEPVCAASAFGWYLFAPITFHVQWDGTDFIWSPDAGESWHPVINEHLPGLPEAFDAKAPEDARGFAPPFLSKVATPGVLQIWTGFMVRTQPDWSVLVRAPANLSRSQHYEHFEGIIETDRWFHPLFVNVRIISTQRPILFESTQPLGQIQPLHRSTYDERYLKAFDLAKSIDDFTATDWDDYRKVVVARGKNAMMRPGRYATEVRKRARA